MNIREAQRGRWRYCVVVLIALGALQCGGATRPALDKPARAVDTAELWVEPADVSTRDLFYGIGGAELVPDPQARYDLISKKHDILSSSPGYKVRDPHGLKWTVKLGAEVRAEVLASRLIWAAGYHQPPLYYVPHWQLYDDDHVMPQQPARFRPTLRRLKKRQNWAWQQNPFVGTRPYRGLVVLMVLLNNWDLTTGNNVIYDVRDSWDGASRWYVVRDVGASFSRNRGRWFQGTRGDLAGFAGEGFIESVKDGRVVFAWNGPHQELLHDISPDDVHWIAERLALLSARQWDDAFRASGYTPQEAALIRRKLDDRINAARRP